MTLLKFLVEKGQKNTWGWEKTARWAKGRQDVVAWRITGENDGDFIANGVGEKVTKKEYEAELAEKRNKK